MRDRTREQLFVESLAVASAGSDEDVRAWLDGLNARELATFDQLRAHVEAWWAKFARVFGRP
jgi:hypothetical protein